jgi:hypothetical protein
MSDLMFGEMTGLTNSQYLIYSDAARIFFRVQAFNQNIRTRRIAGNKTLSYYVFTDNTERILYRQGQFILSQNDPTNTALYQDVVQI